VKIRLSRKGQTKRPFYRVVAADSRAPRDGDFIEILGTYNPMVEPKQISLNEDKVKEWISKGALPSKLASSLIKKTIPGYLEEIEKNRLDKKQAARKKRKERSK
ncbi:UNVERIFIED_CONTAM: hypothetical protein GTU68_051092, partial [Idotea baltica]|nr:hypothetical protein [Idotea baltica]